MVKERNLEEKIYVDSCALTIWYVGQPIDPRMAEAAKGKGLVYDHRARQIADEDFAIFDHILAVDREVLHFLEELAQEKGGKDKIALATSFSKRFKDLDMHDPYYGGPEGFKKTVEMAEDVCQGLLEYLKVKNA